MAPETRTLGRAPGALTIPRVVVRLPPGGAVQEYLDAGLFAFDADADAEVDVDSNAAEPHKPTSHPQNAVTLAHWAPLPEVVGADACAAAVDAALAARGPAAQSLDLLQYRVWNYEDPSYLTNLYHLSLLQAQGKIKHLGVAHMDLVHLRMLAASGYDIVSNRVSMSVLDRRAEVGGLAAWCAEHGVGLLASGVLLGGFVSAAWAGRREPEMVELGSGRLKQYKRFIDAAGGWDAFQNLLAALGTVATKHSVPLAAVAMRYVLDIPGVAAVVVDSEELAAGDDNSGTSTILKTFSFTLDDADRAGISAAQRDLTPIPGDCGDEYRYPPYLTASGDMAHLPFVQAQQRHQAEIERIVAEGGRVERSSGSPWEPICGYCRAVRIGDTFEVAGTTTRAHPSGKGVIGGASVADQTTNVMDIIAAAVRGVGARMSDITRTRIFIHDVAHWRGVAEVHGATMRHYGVRPVNTMVGGNTLIGDGILVEVEAMGVVRRPGPGGAATR